jgi:hypothetical protein
MIDFGRMALRPWSDTNCSPQQASVCLTSVSDPGHTMMHMVFSTDSTAPVSEKKLAEQSRVLTWNNEQSDVDVFKLCRIDWILLSVASCPP